MNHKYSSLTNLLQQKGFTAFNLGSKKLIVKRVIQEGIKNHYSDKEKKTLAKQEIFNRQESILMVIENNVTNEFSYSSLAEKKTGQKVYLKNGKVKEEIKVNYSFGPTPPTPMPGDGGGAGSLYYTVKSVSYYRRVGAAKYSHNLRVPEKRLYRRYDFMQALYDIEGTAKAKLPSHGINLDLSVKAGIRSGRFKILAGSEVAQDGQKYGGDFKDPEEVRGDANSKTIPLTFGVEDYTDGDYNDGRLEIVLLEIEDPKIELSATAGTKKSNEEKYSYDSSDTGLLGITMELKNSDGTSLGDISEMISWNMDEVGSSVRSWSLNWEGDSNVGKGNIVNLTFTGLPKNNSDFGSKEMRIYILDRNDKVIHYEAKQIQIFYNATASNSPSKANGTSDPNWFTYYKDAAGSGKYKCNHNNNHGTSYATPGGGESTIRIADSSFSGIGYYITEIKNNQLRVTGAHDPISYYLGFIKTLAHEREHADNHVLKGTNGDSDNDFATTSYETSTMKTDPNDPYSATRGTGFKLTIDAEIYASKVGGNAYQKALKNNKNREDWASPGGQY